MHDTVNMAKEGMGLTYIGLLSERDSAMVRRNCAIVCNIAQSYEITLNACEYLEIN